jgi:hypothetical protein
MTALEAAPSVLQDQGKPLHYREITKRIRARGTQANSDTHT